MLITSELANQRARKALFTGLVYTNIDYLTNRFHFAVRLFSYRSQMTSKCGKNKKVAHELLGMPITMRTLTRLLYKYSYCKYFFYLRADYNDASSGFGLLAKTLRGNKKAPGLNLPNRLRDFVSILTACQTCVIYCTFYDLQLVSFEISEF